MTETPTPADTPESWGAASRGYAEKVAPYLMRAFAEPLIDRLGISKQSRVLEVGAGSGALTEVLYPRVEALLAIDYAPQMITVLRERLDAVGASNVDCRIMDGQALALEDSSFDAAAASFALMLFSDPGKGFAEMARVVRPGGRVAVSGWAGPEKFEMLGYFLAAMKAAFPDMPPPASPPPVFRLSDPVQFRAWMETAGLSDVEVEFVARDLEVADFATFWDMLTVGAPPVRMLFDRVGPSGKERLQESLEEIVAREFGSGPIKMTNVATLGAGTVR